MAKKGPKFKRTNVEINEEHLKRFKELFPQNGALKWFLNGCFAEFFVRYEYDVDKDIRESVEAAIGRMKG